MTASQVIAGYMHDIMFLITLLEWIQNIEIWDRTEDGLFPDQSNVFLIKVQSLLDPVSAVKRPSFYCTIHNQIKFLSIIFSSCMHSLLTTTFGWLMSLINMLMSDMFGFNNLEKSCMCECCWIHTWPCRSVLRSISAQVSVWAPSIKNKWEKSVNKQIIHFIEQIYETIKASSHQER